MVLPIFRRLLPFRSFPFAEGGSAAPVTTLKIGAHSRLSRAGFTPRRPRANLGSSVQAPQPAALPGGFSAHQKPFCKVVRLRRSGDGPQNRRTFPPLLCRVHPPPTESEPRLLCASPAARRPAGGLFSPSKALLQSRPAPPGRRRILPNRGRKHEVPSPCAKAANHAQAGRFQAEDKP